MLLVVGLLGCLTLPVLGGEPPSAHNIIPGKPCIPLFILTLDGKLLPPDDGPQIPEIERWVGPVLETNGSQYGLDFSESKDLLKQAEKLYGKKVRVTGRLEKRNLGEFHRHQVDVLVVSKLQAVESVEQTIKVEIKGKLSRRLMVINPERILEDQPHPETWTVWEITANGTTYELNIAALSKVETLANQFLGRTVIVTGTRTGNVIHVDDMKPDDGGVIKKTVHVEMKGQFLWRADHCDILIPDSRLIVNGKTYVVKLGEDRKLWHAAVALDGHRAIVTGTLDGDTITATAIKADEDFVKKTVAVEIKGQLYWNKNLLRCRVPEFQLVSGKEYFGLSFASDELRKQAEKLSGEDVLVTGTLRSDVPGIDHITVTSLKADDSKYVKEKVSVTLHGKMQYVITQWDTGKVLFTCDKLPEFFCKCWSIRYGVTIDGKLYLFNFDGNKALGAEAEKLVGKVVVVTGTLKDEVVAVSSMKPLS
jgi:hypothetical protein